jgi:hypothetical protein
MRAISRGRAWLLRGGGMRGGMRRGCSEDARVRVGQCGVGVVCGCGERIRGPDRAVGVVGACAAAQHGVARVRGLRLAWGLCEIGLVWVEVCGLVGTAAVVGRGWRRRERAGRRPLGRSAAVGSAAVWGLGLCGWLAVWCGACAGGGTGLWSATRCAMRARRRAAAVGSWLVVCAASTRPLSEFLFCCAMRAISRGRGCLLRGRGDARRDATWLQ